MAEADGSSDKNVEPASRAVIKWFGGISATAAVPFAATCFFSGLNRSLQTNYSLSAMEIPRFFVDNIVEFNIATLAIFLLIGLVCGPYLLLFISMWFRKPSDHPTFETFFCIGASFIFFISSAYAGKQAGEIYGNIMKSTRFETNDIACSQKPLKFQCGRKLFSRDEEGICVVLFDSNQEYNGSVCWKKSEFEIKEIQNGV